MVVQDVGLRERVADRRRRDESTPMVNESSMSYARVTPKSRNTKVATPEPMPVHTATRDDVALPRAGCTANSGAVGVSSSATVASVTPGSVPRWRVTKGSIPGGRGPAGRFSRRPCSPRSSSPAPATPPSTAVRSRSSTTRWCRCGSRRTSRTGTDSCTTPVNPRSRALPTCSGRCGWRFCTWRRSRSGSCRSWSASPAPGCCWPALRSPVRSDAGSRPVNRLCRPSRCGPSRGTTPSSSGRCGDSNPD